MGNSQWPLLKSLGPNQFGVFRPGFSGFLTPIRGPRKPGRRQGKKPNRTDSGQGHTGTGQDPGQGHTGTRQDRTKKSRADPGTEPGQVHTGRGHQADDPKHNANNFKTKHFVMDQ